MKHYIGLFQKQRNKKRGLKAFTIAEFVTSSAIIFMVFGVLWIVYAFIQDNWATGYATMKLERDGGTVMERMVRGLSGEHGIREAKAVSLLDDGLEYNTIDFSVDANNDGDDDDAGDYVSRVYYDGAQRAIYYMPDITAGLTYLVASDVQNLTFSRPAATDIIEINAEFQQNAGRKVVNVPMQTIVRFSIDQ